MAEKDERCVREILITDSDRNTYYDVNPRGKPEDGRGKTVWGKPKYTGNFW